jgi:hypothetical protein
MKICAYFHPNFLFDSHSHFERMDYIDCFGDICTVEVLLEQNYVIYYIETMKCVISSDVNKPFRFHRSYPSCLMIVFTPF